MYVSVSAPNESQPREPIKGSIRDRVSIDERPRIVEEKKRIGDWEIDLMMGGQGGGALLTLVERKSRFSRIEPVDSKHASYVAQVLINALRNQRQQVHTMTMDNGNKVAQHQKSRNHYEPMSTLPIPIAPGTEGSTRIPTASYGNTFPKALNLKR